MNEPEEPKNQLPATIASAEVTADQRAPNVVPALIADLGEEAAWRYVEFFTANIRNPHTRRAYARACIFPLGVFIIQIITALLSFSAHVYLDNQYHISGSSLLRFAWFRRKQQLHFIHHTHGDSNFALIDNFWDRLLGTYRNPDADDVEVRDANYRTKSLARTVKPGFPTATLLQARVGPPVACDNEFPPLRAVGRPLMELIYNWQLMAA